MILRELKVSDQIAFEKMLDAWDDSPGFSMMYGLTENLSFPKIVETLNNSMGEIPSTNLYAFEGEEIIGKVSIRHKLNENLNKVGGHIGYGVIPSARGKGYASLMLKEALVYTKALGLEKVLVTCGETNSSSRRVIEKNGGVLENILHGVMRFWITSPSSL